jgi:hypothetical protein
MGKSKDKIKDTKGIVCTWTYQEVKTFIRTMARCFDASVVPKVMTTIRRKADTMQPCPPHGPHQPA